MEYAMKLVIVSLTFCCSFTLGLASECPDEEWKRLGNSCFFFSTLEMSWMNARYFCQSLPGEDAYLAYILYPIENEFVRERLNTYNYVHFYHIGATDMEQEGRFVWERKGIAIDDHYANWSPSEPNEAGDEDCTEISTRDGRWNDIPCSKIQRFICRLEL